MWQLQNLLGEKNPKKQKQACPQFSLPTRTLPQFLLLLLAPVQWLL